MSDTQENNEAYRTPIPDWSKDEEPGSDHQMPDSILNRIKHESEKDSVESDNEER